MQFPFSVITGGVCHRLLHEDLLGCIEIVRAAYLAHAAGHSINPPSAFLRFPDRPNARIIALPAHLGAPVSVSGVKWIASYPDNIRSGFPRASAALLLSSHEHGYPFACLESSIISAGRTAASAVLAAQHLTPSRTIRSLGLIGAGLISRYVYRFFVSTGWDIERVKLYDTDSASAHRFVDRWCDVKRHEKVEVAADLESVVKTCDLVVFATVALQPHVFDPGYLAHRPVVLHLSLRDLGAELILGAFNVVDDVDHVMSAGTSLHLAEKQVGARTFVAGTLADVLMGRCKVDHERPIVFSPFGMGILDVAVGKWIHDRAVALGLHQPIHDFFFDLDR